MADPIREFMHNQGYVIYDQIPYFQGKIDFVGIKNEECIIIESKVSKWKDAIKQAINYGKGADCSYVALPKSTAYYCYKNHKKIFDESLVGLLSVESTDNNVEILIKPLKKKHSLVMHKYLIATINIRKELRDKRVLNFKSKINTIKKADSE